MPTTTYWSPNQAAIAQVETYTFSAPNSVGNTYSATINGKTLTYYSVSGDTAATVATALLALLNAQTLSTGITELAEITFANPSDGVLTATASTPGTPFANVTVNGVANQGLVLSTGNGLSNGITTTHTQANQSPSDVFDPQNWLRVTTPAPGTRSLPQNGDAVVVSGTSIPMLWNLDRLIAVQFASYARTRDMTGAIGLPPVNATGGYKEWRAQYFRFVGPQGSVPAGGLVMTIGSQGAGGGNPAYENYSVGSQQTTLNILSAGTVSFLGVHTANTFTLLAGATLNVAMNAGEIATLTTSLCNGGTLNIGTGVTWTAASTLTINGGVASINSAPATLALVNGAQVTVATDLLTWTAITAQNGCALTFLAGGTVTSLTMMTSSSLDKSQDARALTIVDHTIDGDTCQIVDPLNSIVYTNAGTVKQQVVSGPYVFTGPRTVKVT